MSASTIAASNQVTSSRQLLDPEYKYDESALDFRDYLVDASQNHNADRRDQDQNPPLPEGPGGNGPGWQGDAAASSSGHPRGMCAVVGAGVGMVVGGVGGAFVEGLAGAAGGSLVTPGVGTIIGGGAGLAGGAMDGAAVGGALGAAYGAGACGGETLPNHVATTGNGEGSRPGKLIGSLDGLKPDEKAYVEEQLAGGHNVEIVPTGPGPTPDFRIDGGPPIELKTVSGVQNQTERGLSGAVSSRIMDSRGQSRNIVIDARRQPGMTSQAARLGIIRAIGADKANGPKIESITVLTPDGPVTWRRP